MKKIVCELCEGTVFDKVDGRFVCKGCGTSYSAEEAKGMMQEVEGEAPIETGATSIPIGNPNQQQLDNILVLATSAYEADNKAEAENYCNQAIVIDAMCYKAWFLKGKAVGWQSSMANLRIEEAAHSFCKAIDFAPEEEKVSLKEQAVEELKNLGLALISLRKDRFIKSPVAEELNGFQHDRRVLIDALLVLLQHGTVVDIPEGYNEQIASIMNQAGCGATDTIRRAWRNVEHPGEKDLTTYWTWCDNIEAIFKLAINASDEDDEADIQRWKNMKIVIELPIDSKSYKREWNSYMSRYDWVVEYTMKESAKQERRNRARKCDDEVKKIEKKVKEKKEAEAKKAEEEKKARIEAYWTVHADEKAALDSEIRELKEKKTAIEKELYELGEQIEAATPTGKVPSEEEKDKIEDQISKLNDRRVMLGIFGGKEKKQIGEEIAALEGRLLALKEKIEEEKKARKDASDQKLAPLTARKKELYRQEDAIVKRIAAINKELTKDPVE